MSAQRRFGDRNAKRRILERLEPQQPLRLFRAKGAEFTASLGLNHTCGRACTLILPRSAVISVPKWCALAVSLIMFTLSRRCREPFPKLN
jgi:hypothetical protein